MLVSKLLAMILGHADLIGFFQQFWLILCSRVLIYLVQGWWMDVQVCVAPDCINIGIV